MRLWHPTATLITLHLLKARLIKLLKKTEQAGGTVFRETVYRRPLAVTVRYGTVERMIFGVAVRYGTLFYQYRPSLKHISDDGLVLSARGISVRRSSYDWNNWARSIQEKISLGQLGKWFHCVSLSFAWIVSDSIYVSRSTKYRSSSQIEMG